VAAPLKRLCASARPAIVSSREPELLACEVLRLLNDPEARRIAREDVPRMIHARHSKNRMADDVVDAYGRIQSR
jgi:hypothetical protein